MQYQITWSPDNVAADSRNQLLQVYIARRIIEKMCQGALRYQEAETGEAMVGVAVERSGKKMPDMYVLETISPVEDAVRHWGKFEQGDDWQGAIFNWWDENWELYRRLRNASYGNAVAARWDAPLLHVGDWHKQPGGMIEPSGGDLQTARRFMREFDREYLLAPIVTLADEAIQPPEANTLIVETSTLNIRIDFWWVKNRGTRFLPFEPIVQDNASVPRLPPVGWWILHQDRYNREVEALENDGLQIMDNVWWDTRGHPPLEICFAIYRPGNLFVVIVITSVSYPNRPPRWRIAPIIRPEAGTDFFAALYQASREVTVNIDWHADRLLVEGIRAIEAEQKDKE